MWNRFMCRFIANRNRLVISHAQSQSLRIDGFEEEAKKCREKLPFPPGVIWERVNKAMETNHTTLFSKDLQRSIYLAESESELETVLKFALRYHKQRIEDLLRYHKFGPVIMRLLHSKKCPQLAYASILNQEFGDFFQDLSSYQVCLDLLFVSKMYQEVLDVFESYRNSELYLKADKVIPRSFQILVFGACYRLRTFDSYEYVLNLLRHCLERNFVPVRKALAFLIALAVYEKDIDMAEEILSFIPSGQEDHIAVRSLSAKVYAESKQYHELIGLLRQVITDDLPEFRLDKRELTKDAVADIAKAAEDCSVPELKAALSELLKLLGQGGHISQKILHQVLCAPVSSIFTAALGAQEHTLENLPQLREGVPLEDTALMSASFDARLLTNPKTDIVYTDDAEELKDVTKFLAKEKRLRKQRLQRQLFEDAADHVRAEGPFSTTREVEIDIGTLRRQQLNPNR